MSWKGITYRCISTGEEHSQYKHAEQGRHDGSPDGGRNLDQLVAQVRGHVGEGDGQ